MIQFSFKSHVYDSFLQACPKSYQAALPEIQEVLRFACKTHRLPLAQTWVPCIQQGKVGCRHSNENYIYCVSTVDRACIVADPNMQEFHEACSEHHLLKGEGIVGEAFKTNQPHFSSDITSLSKTEYPLSHHARLFGLHAAVAIHLQSIHTGTDDFVLEFFLPTDCRDPEEQKNVLNSLFHIIQQVCWSLRVVTGKELEEDTNLPVNGTRKLSREEILKEKCSEFCQPRQDSNLKVNVDCGEECSMHGEGNFPGVGKAKTGEKRRTKAEKTIPLEVLQQYFVGSLKDASKSIGGKLSLQLNLYFDALESYRATTPPHPPTPPKQKEEKNLSSKKEKKKKNGIKTKEKTRQWG